MSFDDEELKDEENPVELDQNELDETLKNIQTLLRKLDEKGPINYPPVKIIPDDFDPEQHINIKNK